MTTPPTNDRPYRLASETGDEHTYVTTDGYRTTFRQVGWHGQTGAFYALDEDPSKHEPGSFGPLWICVEHEPIVTDEETALKAMTKDRDFWRDQYNLAANVAATIADLDEEVPALRQLLRQERARRKAAEVRNIKLECDLESLATKETDR